LHAALLNKEKLETAMLDQIQEQILRKKMSAAISSLFSNRLASPTCTPVEQALKRTLTDVETRIRRWEDTLERQLLSLRMRLIALRNGERSAIKKDGVF